MVQDRFRAVNRRQVPNQHRILPCWRGHSLPRIRSKGLRFLNAPALLCALAILAGAGSSSAPAADGYANFNGITTGGEAGPTVTVTTASEFLSFVGSTAPYVVQFQGSFSFGGGFTVRSDKTILGLGTNALINGTMYLSGVSNVVVQNVSIMNPEDENEDGTDDEDGMTVVNGTHHIWVDHCTFYDCLDGELDITKGSDFVTVSWCKFYYTRLVNDPPHNFVNLIGHDDKNAGQDTGKLHVTFHHNWWSTLCKERMPRVRFGQAHVYNNYYCSSNNYCVGVGCSSQILVENDYFDNVKLPWKNYSTNCVQGLIHWNSGNVFANGTIIPTWASNSTVFTPPYPYSLDVGTSVPGIVTNNAGAGWVPNAAFTASTTGGAAPLTVTFADTSTGFITDRSWDFGDGATTNTSATNVVHTYSAPGKYLPQLIVSSPAGVSTNALTDYIDTDPPSVGFIAPPSGIVSNTIAFSATATDNVALARVQFYRDDDILLDTATTPPYGLTVNTATVDDGPHCFYAKAYDAANNVGSSSTNCVNVDNNPPSVPVLKATSVSSNQIDLSWSASIDPGSGVAGYNVFREGSQIAVTGGTNYSDQGLAGATVYCYSVAAFDNVGRVSSQSAACAQTFTKVEAMLGTYNGLLIQTNAPSHASSGLIRLVVGQAGSFAARLTMGGARVAFTGQFDDSGNAATTVARRGLSSVQVILHLDLAGADQITGTISDGAFTSVLLADREVYSRANPCPFAGRFGVVLEPPEGNDLKIPQGIGYGTLVVATTGRGRVTGVLADGTKINVTVPLSKHGTWPLYDLLYKNHGASIGWVTLATNHTLEATVDWFRPSLPTSAYFPDGFTTNVALIGHEYAPPSAYNSPSATPHRQISLGGGNLANNIVKSVYVYNVGNVVVLSPNSENLKIKLDPATGQFSGSFTHPQLNKTVNFNGSALQFDGTWAGYFLGADSSGYVIVQPTP